MRESIVISLGGSVIAPDGVDVRFLRRFAKVISLLSRRYRIAIICGGGSVARMYIEAARLAGTRSADDLHRVGIKACQLNAELLRTAFRQRHPVVLDKSTLRTQHQNPIIVAPSRPGFTSDYGSVLIARQLGARRVINITNVDGVYTADPRKVKGARLLTDLSWPAFIKMFNSVVRPGMHAPFDPLASRLAARSGVSVSVVGPDVTNMRRAVFGQRFRGTILGSA